MTCQLGGNFSAPNWPVSPGCVNTCTNFPKFKGTNSAKFPFMHVSTDPVLAGRYREFACKNSGKIPLYKNSTTGPFKLKCRDDGTFEVRYLYNIQYL